MVFFIGLNVDVKIKTSPFACSIACSSLTPTTERGGMLWSNRKHKLIKQYNFKRLIICATNQKFLQLASFKTTTIVMIKILRYNNKCYLLQHGVWQRITVSIVLQDCSKLGWEKKGRNRIKRKFLGREEKK